MEKSQVQKELLIMIAHYLKDKNPDIYDKLRKLFVDKKILSENESDIESILNIRFASFPADQFLMFLKTLTPNDDYPSLFRRMTAFSQPNEFVSDKCSLRLLCSNEFHSQPIFSIEIDPLSRFFITASDDTTMKIVSLYDFRELLTLKGHTNVISNLSINYDVSLLLSSSFDKTIKIWSLNSGECISTLTNFTTSDIHYSIFSPNGQKIASACEDGTMCIWNLEDALQQKPPYYSIKSHELKPVVWLAFSPGSDFLAYVSEPNRVNVISLSVNKTYDLRLHTGKVTYVAFSKRLYPTIHGMAPKLLTYSDEEGSVSIWSLINTSFVPIQVYKPPSSGKKHKIQSLAWDIEDHIVVIVRNSGVLIFDSINGDVIQELPEIQEIAGCYLVAANPKHPNIFSFVTTNGIFSVWDIHELELLATSSQSSQVVYNEMKLDYLEMKWSPCGKFLLASDKSGRVLIFSFTTNNNKYPTINLKPPVNTREILNFQVHTDMSFSKRCEEAELSLNQRVHNVENDDNSNQGRETSNIHVQQPPDSIKVINDPPLNPHVLLPNDNPNDFQIQNNSNQKEDEIDYTKETDYWENNQHLNLEGFVDPETEEENSS